MNNFKSVYEYFKNSFYFYSSLCIDISIEFAFVALFIYRIENIYAYIFYKLKKMFLFE